MPSARVPNFLPSMSGFHFTNGFSSQGVSDLISQALPLVGPIDLGNPGNGLCGGFVFAVIDFFTAQKAPVLMRADVLLPNAPQNNPVTPGDPLFNYLFERLLDTFVLGLVGPKTLLWLVLPTHDNWLSGWLTPHGLAWLMVHQEWPAIQADLDAGKLSPLGLVTNNISTCHQVLAHGYDLDDQHNLTIYCYDPNEPNLDGSATLSLNIRQSYHTIAITSTNISANDEPPSNPRIRGIFRSNYSTVHAAAALIGPLGIGQVPASALALQPLAPSWNSWQSPFSSLFNSAGLTVQNPAQYSGSPLGGPYPPLEANPATTPSACSWGENRIDLFIQDQSGFADHVFFDSGAVGLDPLQQAVVSCPCAVSWGSGRVDAFAVLNDLDYSLVHLWLDGGQLQQSESLGKAFGNWNGIPIPLDGSASSATRLEESTGWSFVSPPCVCSWGPSRIDVFAFANTPSRGNVDARIAQLTFDGSWQLWHGVPLPGGITLQQGCGPLATCWGPGQIDLFFVDIHGSLWHASFTASTAGGNDTWTSWNDLGAPPPGLGQVQPCVVSWGVGRLDVFVIANDNNLYHQWYDASAGASWASAWESRGGGATGGLQGIPTATAWGPGRLDVFARGLDVDTSGNAIPALWHLAFDQTWGNWEALGGVIQGDPAALSWRPGRIDVFAAGGNIFSLGSQNWVPWHLWFQGS